MNSFLNLFVLVIDGNNSSIYLEKNHTQGKSMGFDPVADVVDTTSAGMTARNCSSNFLFNQLIVSRDTVVISSSMLTRIGFVSDLDSTYVVAVDQLVEDLNPKEDKIL
jgi:hypothetical protein